MCPETRAMNLKNKKVLRIFQSRIKSWSKKKKEWILWGEEADENFDENDEMSIQSVNMEDETKWEPQHRADRK